MIYNKAKFHVGTAFPNATADPSNRRWREAEGARMVRKFVFLSAILMLFSLAACVAEENAPADSDRGAVDNPMLPQLEKLKEIQ